MERMLRKEKDNSEYEIDRELTGKFAIEKNAEYQEKIEQLEEENKTLKDNVEFLHSCLDDRDKSISIMQEENKNLKSDLDKYKKYYDRDKEELMESCYSLAKENDELKKELEKLKSTYVYDAKQARDIC